MSLGIPKVEKPGRVERRLWKGMLRRCYSPKDVNYHNYGGRGIRVRRRWHTFENFLADMGFRPSPKHSIERIDNAKAYGRTNCRWATQKEQLRNTRRNRWITWRGQTLVLSDWPAVCGLSFGILRYRLSKTCFFPTLDSVFLTPRKCRPPKLQRLNESALQV